MRKDRYEILSGSTSGITYQIPIYLESSVDEMGIMVGFDGDIEQIEQYCNFTYSGSGNTIIIYNTINTNKLRTLIDSVFTISWGEGSDTELDMTTVYDTDLKNALYTYTGASGLYNIEITVNSLWQTQKLKRQIYIPFSGITYPNPVITDVTQDYLQDYATLTGNTDPVTGVTISFLAIGKSRIDEKRNYGSSNTYSDIDYLSKVIDGEIVYYTGYTISGNTVYGDLYYMDFPENYTYITGNTLSYYVEELYNGMITRNEHLIGFLDEPQIYSDIFIERGKQGVMERNLRLGEIDSTGELDIYGSGYFKVKKQ
jgi:hypothetical protein